MSDARSSSEKMPDALLSACKPKEDIFSSKYDFLHSPFLSHGGKWLTASNGRMMVAVLADGRDATISPAADDILKDAVPPEAGPFDARRLKDVAGELALPVVEVCRKCNGAPTVECRECDGDGECRCKCGDNHDCGNCEGKGKTTCDNCDGTGKETVPPPVRFIKIRGTVFDKNVLARMFKALPGLADASVAKIDDQRIELFGERVRGIAMCCVTDNPTFFESFKEDP